MLIVTENTTYWCHSLWQCCPWLCGSQWNSTRHILLTSCDKNKKEQESGTTFHHSVHKELEALCSDGSYFNTWATVFGPNQDPTDFPSETPIEAVKKKHVMLNNDCQYVNIIITKLNKTFRLLTFFNLTMTDIYMQKKCPLLQRGA